MTTLDAVSDLCELAEDVREARPDLAERLSRDARAILDEMAPLPAARVAKLLSVSRPTVYGLVEAGYLAATAAGGRTAIDPASVVDILPVVREWQANGAVGGLRPHLRTWFEGERRAKQERQRYRGLIKAGYDPDVWPDELPAEPSAQAPIGVGLSGEPGAG